MMRSIPLAVTLLFLLSAPLLGTVLAEPEDIARPRSTPTLQSATATPRPTWTPEPTRTPDPSRPTQYEYYVNANTAVRCYVLTATATDPRILFCLEVTNNPRPVN